METRVKGLMKTLQKEHQTIRVKKKRDREAVPAFLFNKQLFSLVEGYLQKEEMSVEEQLLTRRFLMGNLLYRNAQRQGAVINIKMWEIELGMVHKTSSEEVMVYKVWTIKQLSFFLSVQFRSHSIL